MGQEREREVNGNKIISSRKINLMSFFSIDNDQTSDKKENNLEKIDNMSLLYNQLGNFFIKKLILLHVKPFQYFQMKYPPCCLCITLYYSNITTSNTSSGEGSGVLKLFISILFYSEFKVRFITN